jgi:predicted esterase YcpF (UPF0227 family)
MHAAIADPRKSVSDEVNEIMDRCNQYNIHNITFCGWSNGGLHAIRMATMFKVDEMALLPILLFDTCEPSYFAKYGTSMYNPTQGIMTEFYQQLLPDNVFDIYESLNSIEENKMRDHVISKITETGMDKEITEQLLTKYDILRRKLLDTRKTTYLNEYHYNCNYKAVLFVTSKHRFAGIDKYLGWQDSFIMDIVELNTNHFAMFRNSIANTIAAKIAILYEKYLEAIS